jgi:hypothetical protein
VINVGAGFIELTAVPEPSSFLMLGTAIMILALCALLRVVRRGSPAKPGRPAVAST